MSGSTCSAYPAPRPEADQRLDLRVAPFGLDRAISRLLVRVDRPHVVSAAPAHRADHVEGSRLHVMVVRALLAQ